MAMFLSCFVLQNGYLVFRSSLCALCLNSLVSMQVNKDGLFTRAMLTWTGIVYNGEPFYLRPEIERGHDLIKK